MILVINNVILPKFIGLGKSQRKKPMMIFPFQSRNLLENIYKFFFRNRISLKKIKGIIVVLGPGSFTDLRKSIVVANLLAEFLKIPLSSIRESEFKTRKELMQIGKKRLKRKFLVPFYYQEPQITKITT